jgi:prepilin-type N-terminal cleavage/methylation domain-containing protein
MTTMRNQNGFSLMEVLASIAMFSVVAAGRAATTVGTIKSNAVSKEITVAAALLHDKVEWLRALDPAANPPDLTAGSHSDPLNPMTPLGQSGGTFNRSWVVTVDSPALGISLVVVTVAWNGTEPRSVTGVTYVCRSRTCT